MLIVGRLTENMIIFRCKKWLHRGIWVDLTWRLLQLQRLRDQFARQTCYVYTSNEPKQAAHFYKHQLKTWFRAGRRPWSLLSDGEQFTAQKWRHRAIFWFNDPQQDDLSNIKLGFLHRPDSSNKNCIHTAFTFTIFSCWSQPPVSMQQL